MSHSRKNVPYVIKIANNNRLAAGIAKSKTRYSSVTQGQLVLSNYNQQASGCFGVTVTRARAWPWTREDESVSTNDVVQRNKTFLETSVYVREETKHPKYFPIYPRNVISLCWKDTLHWGLCFHIVGTTVAPNRHPVFHLTRNGEALSASTPPPPNRRRLRVLPGYSSGLQDAERRDAPDLTNCIFCGPILLALAVNVHHSFWSFFIFTFHTSMFPSCYSKPTSSKDLFKRTYLTKILLGVFVVYMSHTCWVIYGFVYTKPCERGKGDCISSYLAERPRLQVNSGLDLTHTAVKP